MRGVDGGLGLGWLGLLFFFCGVASEFGFQEWSSGFGVQSISESASSLTAVHTTQIHCKVPKSDMHRAFDHRSGHRRLRRMVVITQSTSVCSEILKPTEPGPVQHTLQQARCLQ